MVKFVELNLYYFDIHKGCYSLLEEVPRSYNINMIDCFWQDYRDPKFTAINFRESDGISFVKYSYNDFKKLINHGSTPLWKAINE